MAVEEPYPEQGPGTAGRVFGAPRPGEPAGDDPRAPSLPHPRADELAVLAGAGRLDRTVESRPADEAARDLLAQRGDYRYSKVDNWLAQALADHSGHSADPAARTAAVGSLPPTVRAHAALPAALARTGARDGELEFAARLAQADPAATNTLAA
ncbi:hypothetical protein ACFY2V_39195 [Streptomyces eurythermus]|uniref:hypothetical protein n=1 Tax=Streptomyces eurythermus TaxID=42237 RepID=UPI00367B2C98